MTAKKEFGPDTDENLVVALLPIRQKMDKQSTALQTLIDANGVLLDNVDKRIDAGMQRFNKTVEESIRQIKQAAYDGSNKFQDTGQQINTTIQNTVSKQVSQQLSTLNAASEKATQAANTFNSLKMKFFIWGMVFAFTGGMGGAAFILMLVRYIGSITINAD